MQNRFVFRQHTALSSFVGVGFLAAAIFWLFGFAHNAADLVATPQRILLLAGVALLSGFFIVAGMTRLTVRVGASGLTLTSEPWTFLSFMAPRHERFVSYADIFLLKYPDGRGRPSATLVLHENRNGIRLGRASRAEYKRLLAAFAAAAPDVAGRQAELLAAAKDAARSLIGLPPQS